MIPDLKQEPDICDHAAQIPVGPYLIGRLVVILGGVFFPDLESPPFRFTDIIHTRLGIQGRDTFLGELEMV